MKSAVSCLFLTKTSDIETYFVLHKSIRQAI